MLSTKMMMRIPAHGAGEPCASAGSSAPTVLELAWSQLTMIDRVYFTAAMLAGQELDALYHKRRAWSSHIDGMYVNIDVSDNAWMGIFEPKERYLKYAMPEEMVKQITAELDEKIASLERTFADLADKCLYGCKEPA
jgi:hypothetical protein